MPPNRLLPDVVAGAEVAVGVKFGAEDTEAVWPKLKLIPFVAE